MVHLRAHIHQWDIGRHSALKVKCQAFPHDHSTGLKGHTPARPPVTDNYHGARAKCNWMWQIGLKISWLTQGLLTLSWPPTPEPPPPKPVPFWVLQEKQLQKIHLSTSSLLTNIFPPVSGGPRMSYSLIEKRSFLPLKSCSYCSPDRRCFKTLSWGQTNYFYQPPSETTPKWERPIMDIWSKNSQISSSAMENPGLTISPCEVLNPATLLPTPKGSLPFHSCLKTLDHWTKSREGLLEDPLVNPEEIWYTDGSSFFLDGRAGYAVVSNFETREAKPLPPVL